jgi:hypothetical protein
MFFRKSFAAIAAAAFVSACAERDPMPVATVQPQPVALACRLGLGGWPCACGRVRPPHTGRMARLLGDILDAVLALLTFGSWPSSRWRGTVIAVGLLILLALILAAV